MANEGWASLAQKRISLVFIVAVATLALSVTVLWRTVHGRSSDQQPYVGKWRFTSGEIKAGTGFPTKPLAGNLAVVEVRDGVLWYRGDDTICSYGLRVGSGKAEVVPGARVDCDTTAPAEGAPKRATSVRMSMVIDAQDQAHFSGEANASIEFKGQRRDLAFTYEGIAVRDKPPAR